MFIVFFLFGQEGASPVPDIPNLGLINSGRPLSLENQDCAQIGEYTKGELPGGRGCPFGQ